MSITKFDIPDCPPLLLIVPHLIVPAAVQIAADDLTNVSMIFFHHPVKLKFAGYKRFWLQGPPQVVHAMMGRTPV